MVPFKEVLNAPFRGAKSHPHEVPRDPLGTHTHTRTRTHAHPTASGLPRASRGFPAFWPSAPRPSWATETLPRGSQGSRGNFPIGLGSLDNFQETVLWKISLGHFQPFFPGIRIFLENHQQPWGNGRVLKRTMAEKNGKSAPRSAVPFTE